MLSNYDVQQHTPGQLRDLMGWSETPTEDATAVIMRLCDLVSDLQRRVEVLERVREREGLAYELRQSLARSARKAPAHAPR